MIVVLGAAYEVGSADFVTVTAGLSTPVPGSVAEAGFPSSEETVTELVSAPGVVEALGLMFAGTVTGGSVVPAATSGPDWQVTVGPFTEQTHGPVPPTAWG